MKSIAVVGLLVLLVTVGCGKEEEKDARRGAEACAATPSPIADPSFPANFPPITDVTWTASQKAGPSQVITGYTGDDLGDLFTEMKEHFAGGGFSVTKDERDPHDAEVNFASSDYTGQVRLAEECQGRTSVLVTIRPAA